jgi:hypothetical protein
MSLLSRLHALVDRKRKPHLWVEIMEIGVHAFRRPSESYLKRILSENSTHTLISLFSHEIKERDAHLHRISLTLEVRVDSELKIIFS